MFADTSTGKHDHQGGNARGRLLGLHDLHNGSPVLAPWMQDRLKEFAARAGDETFPCLFGIKAWKKGTIRFLFAECQSTSKSADIVMGLTEYTDFVRKVRVSDRLLAPLVVFLQTSRVGTGSLHQIGWEVLNKLHEMDPAPWPNAVPTSPDEAEWCFCFNGVQLFVNMSTPEHLQFRSRNLGQSLTFVINPRENFDAVASTHTLSGRLVRQNIRNRVAAYNSGAVPDELGFYGDPDNREWLQYQLAEPSLPRPSSCPFRPNPKPGSGSGPHSSLVSKML